MHSRQLSLLTILGILFGIVALAISIYAITQSTEYRQHASTGAVLYITGSPETAVKGQEVSVSLDEDTDAVPIVSVSINLDYPNRKVTFLRMDTGHSPFNNSSSDIKGDGYIQFSRDADFPVTGRNHIATLYFLATDTFSLNDLKTVPGTALLNTSNKNIFTSAAVQTGGTIPQPEPQVFSIQFFFSLFKSFFGQK